MSDQKILQGMMVKEMQGKKIPSYNVHYRAQRPDESDNDFLERILAEFKKNPSSKLECIKNIEPKPHAIGISVKQEGDE